MTALEQALGSRQWDRPRASGHRRTGRALLAVVSLLVLAAAIAGAVLTTNLVRTRSERAAIAALADPSTPGLGIGQQVRTSFGAIRVAEATVNNGLSTADLGGMNHGVSSLVSQGHALITLVATVNNTTHRPVVVQASQFRLRTGRGSQPSGAPMAAAATTLQAGPLPGRAVVDVRVTFVAPTDGSRLWLEYADPARNAPVRFALGTTSRIAKAQGGHQH